VQTNNDGKVHQEVVEVPEDRHDDEAPSGFIFARRRRLEAAREAAHDEPLVAAQVIGLVLKIILAGSRVEADSAAPPPRQGIFLPTVLPVAAGLETGDVFGGSIADPHARWQAQDGIAELRKCSKQLRRARAL